MCKIRIIRSRFPGIAPFATDRFWLSARQWEELRVFVPHGWHRRELEPQGVLRGNTDMAIELDALGEPLAASRRGSDRREKTERRTGAAEGNFSGDERRQTQRRKVERRRQIDPTTCEREYTDEEIEFMRAMDEYKRKSGRMFPTWSEVLEVVRDLGYKRG
jgi:hypothetical protein